MVSAKGTERTFVNTDKQIGVTPFLIDKLVQEKTVADSYVF